MPANPVERFWDFSVRTYRTSGVPEACLSLQDEHGVDVNMFLYCCWVAVCRGDFDAQLWSNTIEYSSAWADNLVRPLRQARTWMKHEGCVNGAAENDACMELREKIKSVEFDAEKMQQEVLESLTTNSDRGGCGEDLLLPTVVNNVSRYCHHIGMLIDSDVAEKNAVIIAAAFPELDKQVILDAFASLEST